MKRRLSRSAGVLLVAAFAAGCTPTPVSTLSAGTFPATVMVPRVSDTIRSRLLLEDSSLVSKRAEELPQAPSTFAVIGDQVVIDDRLNSKFGIYQNGRRIIDFEQPTSMADFAIRNGNWYLLTGDDTIGVYTRTTKGLKYQKAIALPKHADDEPVYSELYFEGSNLIAEAGSKALAEGPGPLRSDPTNTNLGRTIHLVDGNVDAVIPVKFNPLGAARIALTDQYAYYTASSYSPQDNSGELYEEFILQFSLDGKLVHTYGTHPSGSTADGREFLVADDKLYQMWISNKTVKVFLLEPNDN